MNEELLDLVIGGPDMSGTSTQIGDVINYFQGIGKIVRDIRGTEIDALFHSQAFQKGVSRSWDKHYLNFGQFLSEVEECKSVSTSLPRDFLEYVNNLLSGGRTNQDLRVASMVKNEVSTYIDPNSADVWIMEEPPKRGSGQVCRTLEQNRSKYGSSMDPVAAAVAHSVYRVDEFFRFRKHIKRSVRSRSEESACYQIIDEEFLPNGIARDMYLDLPGHKIAFANPPSHIFVVCGPKDWTTKDYLELKEERNGGRMQDDHEKDAPYQILVNKRYASDWIDNLYKEGCGRFGVDVPEITRFNIYNSKDEIRRKMGLKLDNILD